METQFLGFQLLVRFSILFQLQTSTDLKYMD